MSTNAVFGLVEIKGKPEAFQRLAKHWLERDKEFRDLEFLLEHGGDDWLFNNLMTGPSHGINPSSVEERVTRFGSNKRKKMRPPSWWKLLFEALGDFTLIVLMVCAVISIAVNLAFAHSDERSIEGFAILLAVVICSVVTATNDYQKANKFRELFEHEQEKKEVQVVRAGKRLLLNPEEIVVGDLLLLQSGMEIQGDGVLIEANEVEIDESSMSGESEPQRKDILRRCLIEKEKSSAKFIPDSEHSVPSPVVLSGTKVLSGDGKYIVINVGKYSAKGSIDALVDTKDEKTPLQEKLESLADAIGKFGLTFAVITFIALMIRLIIEVTVRGHGWDNNKHPASIVRALIIAVVVVAIPEGLPLAVTLSLAFSVKEMLKEHNLVRKLNACETMGNADCICSDKTGTLTMNEMFVTEFMNSTPISVIDVANPHLTVGIEKLVPRENMRELLIECIVANSTEDPKSNKGSKTELALLKYLQSSDVNVVQQRAKYNVDKRVPFSSNRKRMSSVVRKGDGSLRLCIKGAAEILLDTCTTTLDLYTGESSQMSESRRKTILETSEKMANKALRVIAIAYKDVSALDAKIIETGEADADGVYNYEKTGNCFVGLFGIMDVLREDVHSSVLKCQAAGIKVRMITGDSKLTAIAIAKKCGILSPEENLNGKVMEGKEFMELIEGVVCSYCRTEKCDCVTTSKAEEQSPQSKPSKDIQVELAPTKIHKSPKIEREIIVGRGALKGSLKQGKDTSKNSKKLHQSKQVKFKDQNEIFDDQMMKVLKKHPTEPVKPKVRIDTIKNQKEFDRIIPRLVVLARSRPQDKYAMIVGLKNRDHIVAVTGDGTNDAPALSKADVGFAMGIAGTDLAKNAADIIITNDNFSSIVNAIVRGRNIYDSIRKFLMFQLTVNVVAVVGTFLSAIFFNNPIISAVQMLWINLIMDTLASLALATEPPIPRDLLKRKPYARHEHILSRKMMKHIIGQSLVQLSILTVIIFNGKDMFEEVSATILDKEKDQNLDATFHFTYLFNVFVWMQIFNFLNCRRLYDEFNVFKGLSKSRVFMVIWVLIVVLQILIVNFGGKAFSLAFMGVGIKGWFICIAFGLATLPASMLIRLVKEDDCFFCFKKNQLLLTPIPNQFSLLNRDEERARLNFAPELIRDSPNGSVTG